MSAWETILTAGIPALLAAAAGLGGSWLLFRGKRVDQEIAEGEVEATAADAFLKGQASFQQYVDSVVEQRVKAAVADVRAELDEVLRKFEIVRRESHEMHNAIRMYATQLWLWNVNGKRGEMPMLPEPILRQLGLIHLTATEVSEDTETTTT